MKRRRPRATQCCGHRTDHAAPRECYATLEERSRRVTRRTRIPSRASMSIRVSVLNRSMRPLSRLLTLGCVTRRSFAACACLRPRSLRTFSIWIMRSARIRRCSDSSGPKPRSRKTLPLDLAELCFRFARFFRLVLSRSRYRFRACSMFRFGVLRDARTSSREEPSHNRGLSTRAHYTSISMHDHARTHAARRITWRWS